MRQRTYSPGVYSLGLLELAFGTALLLAVLCSVLVSLFELYPPVGFLPAFLAAPALFWGATYTQKRLPEGAKRETISAPPRYLMPLVFGACLLLPIIQAFVFPSLFSDFGALLLSIVFAGGLYAVSGSSRQTRLSAGLSLLLGLGLTLFAPAERALMLYCLIVGVLLIFVGASTLRRELPR